MFKKYKITIETGYGISADMTYWAKMHDVSFKYIGIDFGNKTSPVFELYIHEFQFQDKNTLLEFILLWVNSDMKITIEENE